MKVKSRMLKAESLFTPRTDALGEVQQNQKSSGALNHPDLKNLKLIFG